MSEAVAIRNYFVEEKKKRSGSVGDLGDAPPKIASRPNNFSLFLLLFFLLPLLLLFLVSKQGLEEAAGSGGAVSVSKLRFVTGFGVLQDVSLEHFSTRLPRNCCPFRGLRLDPRAETIITR